MSTLSDAIKQVMQTSGHTALSVENVRTLDGSGAFGRQPAARFILLTAARSGVTSRLTNLGEGTPEVAQLFHRFIRHTGFDPAIATEILSAYAEALGWNPANCQFNYQPSDNAPRPASLAGLKSGEPTTENANDNTDQDKATAEEPAEEYVSQSANAHNGDEDRSEAHLTIDEKIGLLNSRLETEHENESILGVKILDAEIIDITPRSLIVNAQLRRTAPMCSATLNYAIFDAGNHLLIAGAGALHSSTAPPFHPLTFEIPLFTLQSPPSVLPHRILLFLS